MKIFHCKNNDLTDLFNSLAPAVKPVAMLYVEDGVLNRVDLARNHVSGEPELTFVFQQQSSPALAYLPEQIDGIKVSHAYQSAYVAHFMR